MLRQTITRAEIITFPSYVRENHIIVWNVMDITMQYEIIQKVNIFFLFELSCYAVGNVIILTKL